MPPRNLNSPYVAPVQADPYYGDYSALAQQYLKGRNHPVYSIGQGIAEALGDVGEAYFEKKALEKGQKKEQEGYRALAEALVGVGKQTVTPEGIQPAQGQLGPHNFAPAAEPGQAVPPQWRNIDQGSPDNMFSSAGNPQASAEASYQKALMALIGKDPKMAVSAIPMLQEAAQNAQAPQPKALPAMKPGETIPMMGPGGQITAAFSAPAEPPKALTEAAKADADYRAGLIDKPTRDRLVAAAGRGEQEPLVQVPDPTDPTQAILVPRSQAVGQRAFQTQRERMPKMQTYYDEEGRQVQLDSNDPEDQKTIKAQGLVSASPSDTERQARGFVDRMQAAEKKLDEVVDKGFMPGNVSDSSKATVPLIGNFLVSPEYQSYRQAQEDWVRAKLRKESGAVIGPKEMEDEITTYFPKPGDGPEIQAQKRASRIQAEKQLASSAGLLGRRRTRELEAATAEKAAGANSPGGATNTMLNGWSIKRANP